MSSPTEAMPPQLSKARSMPPEGIVQMPWVKGHSQFFAGDTVRFNFQVQRPTDLVQASVDGGAWISRTPDTWITLTAPADSPGPHIIRIKAIRGVKTSRIQEFRYYIEP